MAFKLKDLSVLAYANGFTLWHYKTDDTDNAVDDTNYFQAAIDMLRVGDMILASTGGPVGGGILRVVFNNGADIDCADLLTIGETDTD